MRNNIKRRHKVTENLSCPWCKSEILAEIESNVLDCGHTQHVLLCGTCHKSFVIATEDQDEKLIFTEGVCLN